jgi:hypothetical protein
MIVITEYREDARRRVQLTENGPQNIQLARALSFVNIVARANRKIAVDPVCPVNQGADQGERNEEAIV